MKRTSQLKESRQPVASSWPRRGILFLLTLAVLLSACRANPRGRRRAMASASAEPEVSSALQQSTVPPSVGPTPTATEGRLFGNAVAWTPYDEARDRARREQKPMMIVVYADWCSQCKQLAPVFSDADVVELSRRFVMVKQNHDEGPGWLQESNRKYGTYVPRIFFTNQAGEIQEQVTSGHPRYPYFYAASAKDLLMRSMRSAGGA